MFILYLPPRFNLLYWFSMFHCSIGAFFLVLFFFSVFTSLWILLRWRRLYQPTCLCCDDAYVMFFFSFF